MPIIVISRGSYSKGVHLAGRLRERLGYTLVSLEEVAQAAAKYGVDQDDLVHGLAIPPSFWERLTSRKDRLLVATRAVLTQMLESGNVIYHGLAGRFILEGFPCVLNVRLIAPMDYRVRAISKQHGLNEDEATRRIAEMDERRTRWVKELFGADWRDPSLYDVVVNLANVSLDAAADMIVELAQRKDYRATPECEREFRNRALGARVRAELLFNSQFLSDEIEFNTTDGVVHLSTGDYLASNLAEISAFLKGIEGVVAVTPDVGDDVALPVALSGTPLSSEDKQAGEIMLPANRYPHVHEWVTVREAVVALSASSVRMADGHIIHPRYLMVLNEKDELVGVVSRRELLKGLLPQIRAAEQAEEHIRRMVPFGETVPELLIRWSSLFTSSSVKASATPVGTVMGPARGVVSPSDPLSSVVTTMIRHGIDLVPVVEDRKLVGVVLMTNVFDLVAEFIIEHGGRKEGSLGT